MSGSSDCQSLSAWQATLMLALDQSEVAIGVTDTGGTITWANRAFADLSGYTCEELPGQQVGIFRSGKHADSFYDGIRDTLAAGKTWSGRLSVARKDGTDVRARAVTAPIHDAGGTCIGYSVFARNTTDEAQMESQLAQLQKMEAIGELAAGIAHEINTPIQYIGDNIQFLRDSVRDIMRLVETMQAACDSGREGAIPQADLEAVEQVCGEIDLDFLREEMPLAIDQAIEGRNRVADIVRAMKEFAHPGDEALTPVDINHAIENTLAVSRGEWKHLADIEKNLAPDLPPVPCFPGSFNQVLLNLVVNAAHAIAERQCAGAKDNGAREKGVIEIFTRFDATSAEVGIRDTGCGIPDHVIHRIFEPFYTTKDVGKGTGQGLALTHAVIVEKMGGRITVDSTPGAGTLITLYLPLEPGAAGSET